MFFSDAQIKTWNPSLQNLHRLRLIRICQSQDFWEISTSGSFPTASDVFFLLRSLDYAVKPCILVIYGPKWLQMWLSFHRGYSWLVTVKVPELWMAPQPHWNILHETPINGGYVFCVGKMIIIALWPDWERKKSTFVKKKTRSGMNVIWWCGLLCLCWLHYLAAISTAGSEAWRHQVKVRHQACYSFCWTWLK